MRTLTAAVALLLANGPSAAQYDFKGYPCTQDCSGHEAGYEWADENDIDDPDDCDGNSQSFIEGCEAYAEEQQGYYSDEKEDCEDWDEYNEECND